MTERTILSAAYRITHFAVITVELPVIGEYHAIGYLEPEDVKWDRRWVTGLGRTRVEAIGDLVQKNLKRNCRIVFERQQWRCAHCGKVRPLQGDHIRPRGRAGANRDDRISNLAGLCPPCHTEKHAAKKQLDKATALRKLGGQITGEWSEVGQAPQGSAKDR